MTAYRHFPTNLMVPQMICQEGYRIKCRGVKTYPKRPEASALYRIKGLLTFVNLQNVLHVFNFLLGVSAGL